MTIVTSSTLPKSIMLSSKLGKKFQPIIYENIGLFYQKCSIFGHPIVDCKKSKTLGIGDEKKSEKEEVDLPNEKVKERALEIVKVNFVPHEVLVNANEEASKFFSCTQGEKVLVVASSFLQVRHLEVEGSPSKVEEGEIIDAVRWGDPFPFLQCIEVLLKKTLGIGEKGEVDMEPKEVCKEIKEDSLIALVDKEVAHMLSWGFFGSLLGSYLED